jgi:hypothetical protein
VNVTVTFPLGATTTVQVPDGSTTVALPLSSGRALLAVRYAASSRPPTDLIVLAWVSTTGAGFTDDDLPSIAKSLRSLGSGALGITTARITVPAAPAPPPAHA